MSITLSTLEGRLKTMMGDASGVYSGNYIDAINNAARELYPTLFRRVENEELVTGSIAPPFIWNSDGDELDIYTEPTGTLAKTTTAGYKRNGLSSAKVTASGADDAIVLDSNEHPRLLDLMNHQVDVKCWALPEVANDAFLDVITTDSDGSDTTESSTTTCAAGVFTLLKIEDYDVPNDIVRLRIKLRVHTDTKYVYFDPPRAIGRQVYDLMLPDDFQKGEWAQVHLQSTSYSDDACDDLHPRYSPLFGCKELNDGSYKYLRLPYAPASEHKLKLIGYAPLEDDLDSATDTMTIENSRVPLLLTYAAYLCYEYKRGVVASEQVDLYDRECSRWRLKVEDLKGRLGMSKPSGQISWTN